MQEKTRWVRRKREIVVGRVWGKRRQMQTECELKGGDLLHVDWNKGGSISGVKEQSTGFSCVSDGTCFQ